MNKNIRLGLLLCVQLILSGSLALWIINNEFNKQYGVLAHGCTAWGEYYNGTYIQNSTTISSNGPDSISSFTSIYDRYPYTSFTCFYSNNINTLTTNIWMYYLAIGLQSFGMLILLITTLYGYNYSNNFYSTFPLVT